MSEITELGCALEPKVAPIWLILWKWIGIELTIIKHQTTKSIPHTDGLMQSIEISDIFRIFLRCISDFWWHFKNRYMKKMFNLQSHLSDNLYKSQPTVYHWILLSSHGVHIAGVWAQSETISGLAHFCSRLSAVISDIVS